MSVKANKVVWAGRVLTLLAAIPFIPSAFMKLTNSPQVIEGMTQFGFPQGIIVTLGIVELLSLVIYLIPQTATLGAILLTGYLGGAIVTHVRVEQPFIIPLVLGVIVWAGLFLRDARLRELLPIRKNI